MTEHLLEIEREAFLWLNGIGRSPFLDEFMWLFSGKVAWIALAAVFVAALFWRNKSHWREAVLLLFAIVVVITFCDQFASGFCKPFFQRFRPTHHPDFMNDVQTIFGYRGGKYGFISSHAANSFGFAMLTALIFRYKPYTVSIFIWALITSYSRIYLGVHFITDIIPGAIVGLITGYGGAFFLKKITSFETVFPRQNIKIVVGALAATVFVLVIISILY
ncbi:MAG: phosphatase PAP2 family protein [Tannerella sp.]|jgi:undecaprenyl-diphosphatase|nr:phosphatase PAP2 family protein [Tannerella sp.]